MGPAARAVPAGRICVRRNRQHLPGDRWRPTGQEEAPVWSWAPQPGVAVIRGRLHFSKVTALLLRGQEARFRSVRKDFVTGGPCQCGVRPCSRPRGPISVAPPWTFPEAQMQLPVADPCFCIREMPPSCWVGGVPPRTGTRGQRALGAEHGAALCPRGARRAQLGSGVHVSAWSGLGG